MSQTDHLDSVMERASVALVRMDYLACERYCLEALAMARRERRWAYYARILLPLQEARRHRRMIAADGVVRLGSTDLADIGSGILEQVTPGCMVVTRPHGKRDALALASAARDLGRYLEVLYCDNEASDEVWHVTSWQGPAVTVARPAPPASWRDVWLGGDIKLPLSPVKSAQRPADWVIDATEALGDAALAQVAQSEQLAHRGQDTDPMQRLAALEACLLVVTDHEIIHQRLGDAARMLAVAQAGSQS